MFQPAPFSLIGRMNHATIETQTKTPDGLEPKTNLKKLPMRETESPVERCTVCGGLSYHTSIPSSS
jgi:hypothetical protein